MAINKVVRNSIGDGEIKSSNIEDGAITSGKISDATTISISKTPIGALPPTISSLDTTQINPSSGATVTITGTRFVSIPNVVFLNTSTGARINASTIGFTSSTTITAAFPSGQTAGTYKVQVENPDGQGVLSTASIIYSIAPTWSTAANLGSVEEGESVNISLVAYDDDSTAVTSYTLVSGSLPSGVTLSGDSTIGTLTGTAPTVSADTAYTFTIRATDNENQTSDRQFNLTITNWTVANSLRFDDGSSDYLNRTPASAGTQTKATISVWLKRSNLTSNQCFFSTGNNNVVFKFVSNDKLTIYDYNGSSMDLEFTTTQLFRDVSAWYNIVVSLDSTQATASDRAKLYVNGSLISDFDSTTYPSLNYNFKVNGTLEHFIGRLSGLSQYFNGYMAEFVNIDGQQLDPTSFGEFDEDSGIWKPISVSGLTFGTNGFYLPFTNSGSLGADSSGNSNDFTVNNLTAVDQSTDTPQNNYATLNPLATNTNTSSSNFSDGNTTMDRPGATSTWVGCVNTMPVTQGKWYAEYKVIDAGDPQNGVMIGVTNVDLSNFQNGGNDLQQSGEYGINYYAGGQILNDASTVATYTAMSDGDIVMIALDIDNGKIYWGRNGTWENSGDPTSGATGTGAQNLSEITTGDTYAFNLAVREDGNVQANFGNPAFSISSSNTDANGYGNFEYAPPSGYFALNTKNLAEYG